MSSVFRLTRVWLVSSLLIPFIAVYATVPVLTSPPQDITFTDVTESAGITFKHISSPEKKYIVESMSGGVALLDYDNDGY